MKKIVIKVIIFIVVVIINIWLVMSVLYMRRLNDEDRECIYEDEKYESARFDTSDDAKHDYMYYMEKYLYSDSDLTLFDSVMLKFLSNSRYDDLHKAFSYFEYVDNSMHYFPVATYKGEENVFGYEDSFNCGRSYGGSRQHKGCDIFGDGKKGYYPIISVSDGTVTHKGWLELGGYRIGITTKDGVYYYYAHMDRYAPDIKENDSVKAGQIIGFLGDTGYGKEGTTGMFDPHLHFGIYIEGEKYAVNPWYFLGKVKDRVLVYEK